MAVVLSFLMVLMPFIFSSSVIAWQTETTPDGIYCIYDFVDEFRGIIPESDYAGMYFDAYGNLVIQMLNENVTGVDLDAVIFLMETKGEVMGVRMEENESYYSLADLNGALEILTGDMEQLGICGAWVDEELNRVGVDVYEITPELIDELSCRVDINMINLYITNLTNQFTATIGVKPGAAAGVAGGTATVAWGATRNNVKGFLIPGHASTTTGVSVTYDGKTLGSISYISLGGSRDVSFVTRSTSPNTFICDDYFYGSTNVSVPYNISSTFVQNQPLFSYGYISGYQTGKVLSTNLSASVNGNAMSNLVKADYKAVGGDSGAPIFHIFIGPIQPSESYSDPDYITAAFGMQSCSSLSSTGQWTSTSYSAFSKLSEITSGTSIALSKFTS